MSDTVYKGQKQVIDGSMVGEAIINTKFDYAGCAQLKYIAESKYNKQDSDYGHFIQKFSYNSMCSLDRILVAVNQTNCNCSDVTIVPLDANRVRVIANNGDFVEATAELDAMSPTHLKVKSGLADELFLKTPSQTISGIIEKKESDTSIIVRCDDGHTAFVAEAATAISLYDLIVTLKNAKTMDFDKRRWDFRARYVYKTAQ